MTTDINPVIPDPFRLVDDPDPLQDAMNVIQHDLNICARDPELSARYRVLQHVYGIVDNSRRVLRGVGRDYQMEKARAVLQDAALLVAELEEQTGAR